MPKSYSQRAILDWLHRSIGVNAMPNPNEVNSVCPVCSGDVFFFNIRKKVGICHKASCNFRPNIDRLIEIVGFAPDESGDWEPLEEASPPEVIIQGLPILRMADGKLLTSNQEALSYLQGRGISDQIILNWEMTCDGNRIYLPVKHEGKLVNFNSRILPGREGKKYLYSKGAKTSHYILGWEECRDWPVLCLVENSYVSLAYRYRLNCTTTFGSNISDIQADMIGRSKVKTVALLWDEGTEKNASRCMKKLHAQGVNTAFWGIKGQPDDHPFSWVEAGAMKVLQTAAEGVAYYVDLR